MLSLCAGTAFSQSPSDKKDVKADDLAAVRRTSAAFETAFEKGDAKAIAALWTEDGDYVNEEGQSTAGREAIQKRYAEFFAQNAKMKIRVMPDSVRLLSGSAAIEDGRAVLEPAPVGAPAISKYTAVHVKVDGKWLMSTVRDTRIETPSGYRNVEDLEFLIGTWTAEEHGAKMESVCRWIANKSFVERTYTVTDAQGLTTTGTQIIGFNADAGHVQSWNFSSDGGHAIGAWIPAENGWTAQIQGVTGAGILTSATNSLRRLDDNAYMWQSVDRTAAGQPLPDTDEIVLKRQSTGKVAKTSK
jgi:uncharacterized protein (TIGR02246 family)